MSLPSQFHNCFTLTRWLIRDPLVQGWNQRLLRYNWTSSKRLRFFCDIVCKRSPRLGLNSEYAWLEVRNVRVNMYVCMKYALNGCVLIFTQFWVCVANSFFNIYPIMLCVQLLLFLRRTLGLRIGVEISILRDINITMKVFVSWILSSKALYFKSKLSSL